MFVAEQAMAVISLNAQLYLIDVDFFFCTVTFTKACQCVCYKGYATWEEIHPGDTKMCVQARMCENLSMHVTSVESQTPLRRVIRSEEEYRIEK